MDNNLRDLGGGRGLNAFYRRKSFTLDSVVVKSWHRCTTNSLAKTRTRPVKQPTTLKHKLNAFYWRQIFTLDSVVVKTQFCSASMVASLPMQCIITEKRSKLVRVQRSGIDTIKYHTWPRIPMGKWQTHSRHHKREPRGQPFPSRWPQSTHKQTRTKT